LSDRLARRRITDRTTSIRKDMATAHRLTAHYGMDYLVWNHISARLPADAALAGCEPGFLITPGNKHYATVRPEHLCINTDTANVTGDVIHGAIYKRRADVGAIVHTHTEAAVFVSCLPEGFRIFTQDGLYFHNKVAYHDFEGVATDHDEQERIARDIGDEAHTIFMRNHGVVCTGKTVAEAWARAFYVEKECKVQMQLMMCKGGAAKPIPAELLNAMVKTTEDMGPGMDTEWNGMKEFAKAHLGCDWI